MVSGIIGLEEGYYYFGGGDEFFCRWRNVCGFFISVMESVCVMFLLLLFSDGTYGVHVVWFVGVD